MVENCYPDSIRTSRGSVAYLRILLCNNVTNMSGYPTGQEIGLDLITRPARGGLGDGVGQPAAG